MADTAAVPAVPLRRDEGPSASGGATPARQGQLPLEWLRGAPATPERVTRAAADGRVDRASSGGLERWVAGVCAAVVEVVAGDRHPRQLFRVASPAVIARLGAATQLPGTRNSPVRRVTSVHLRHVAPDTIEACAVVQGARRCQAVALQLKRRRTAWIVTAAEVR